MSSQDARSSDPAGAPRELTASEVMNSSPRTCSRFSRVLEAVLIFKEEDCGMVPVVEEGKPIGVVTDRDVALALTTEDLVNRPIEQIMSEDVIMVTTTTPLSEIIETMRRELIRRILVVNDQGMLMGVISWKDLAGELTDGKVGQIVTDVVESPAGN